MVGPVVERRPNAGQRLELARHEIAERGARHVDIVAVAIDEIHWHIERVVDIALEAHALLKGEGQKPGAIRISVAPHLGTVRPKAVGLTIGEGRVGEERGGDRLKREPDPELGYHVGLAGEIHVHLHRGGAEHHVEAVFAARRHIALHDPVALLRHHRRLNESPFRREAEPKEADAEIARDFPHLGEMLADLFAGLVDRLERCARQLELTPRLETDGAAPRAVLAPKGDDVVLLGDGVPAEIPQSLEQRADAAVAVIRDRCAALFVEAELLVLGADAPIAPRLAACFEISRELIPRGDDGAFRPAHLCRHEESSVSFGGSLPRQRGSRSGRKRPPLWRSLYRPDKRPYRQSISTATGRGPTRESASMGEECGATSSAKIRSRPSSQSSMTLVSFAGSITSGTCRMPHCSAASMALARMRSSLTRSATVWRVITGLSALTPISVAF